jgi:hypothetical protein
METKWSGNCVQRFVIVGFVVAKYIVELHTPVLGPHEPQMPP